MSDDDVYRIYVSLHSGFVSDEGVQIPARHLRFLRRLLRDETHRRTNAADTLFMWGYVIRGEELYIQPYRSLSDRHINSAHAFEPYL